jgi:hypothetical protein
MEVQVIWNKMSSKLTKISLYQGNFCLQLQGLIQNFLGPEDEGRKLLQNIGDYLRINKSSYARRLGSSVSVFK